jgi:hypothetical protein
LPSAATAPAANGGRTAKHAKSAASDVETTPRIRFTRKRVRASASDNTKSHRSQYQVRRLALSLTAGP